MNTQTIKHLRMPLLGGGIVVLLVSGIAIASLAISAQGSNGILAPAEPPDAAAALAGAVPGAGAYRCPECGVIDSVRKIETPDELIEVHAPGRSLANNRGEGKPVGKYAITIRLQDGSMRVITDAHPANWRPGERVHLIGGME
jgi:hypothetical protein